MGRPVGDPGRPLPAGKLPRERHSTSTWRFGPDRRRGDDRVVSGQLAGARGARMTHRWPAGVEGVIVERTDDVALATALSGGVDVLVDCVAYDDTHATPGVGRQHRVGGRGLQRLGLRRQCGSEAGRGTDNMTMALRHLKHRSPHHGHRPSPSSLSPPSPSNPSGNTSAARGGPVASSCESSNQTLMACGRHEG